MEILKFLILHKEALAGAIATIIAWKREAITSWFSLKKQNVELDDLKLESTNKQFIAYNELLEDLREHYNKQFKIQNLSFESSLNVLNKDIQELKALVTTLENTLQAYKSKFGEL